MTCWRECEYGRVGSITRRTCSGGFASDDPAGQTLSILDLLQQKPASFAAASIRELISRWGGPAIN
jgi:hypothetical protein